MEPQNPTPSPEDLSSSQSAPAVQKMTKDEAENETNNLVFERLRELEINIRDAKHCLDEAKKERSGFQKAILSGEIYSEYLGNVIIRWADVRHLPTGEAITIEQGEDWEIPAESLAGQLQEIEKQTEGWDLEQYLKGEEMQEQWENYESAKYDY